MASSNSKGTTIDRLGEEIQRAGCQIDTEIFTIRSHAHALGALIRAEDGFDASDSLVAASFVVDDIQKKCLALHELIESRLHDISRAIRLGV